MEPGESVEDSGGNITVDSTGDIVSEEFTLVECVVALAARHEGLLLNQLSAEEKWNMLLHLYCTQSSKDDLSHVDLLKAERKLIQQFKTTMFENSSGFISDSDSYLKNYEDSGDPDHEAHVQTKGEKKVMQLSEKLLLVLLRSLIVAGGYKGMRALAYSNSEDFVVWSMLYMSKLQSLENTNHHGSLLPDYENYTNTLEGEEKKNTVSPLQIMKFKSNPDYKSHDSQLTGEGKVKSMQLSSPPLDSMYLQLHLHANTPSSICSVHPSIHSSPSTAGSDSLPSSEPSLDNFSEYFTTCLHWREEEEEGSVQMFIRNSLADPQPPVHSTPNTTSSNEVATVQKLVEDLGHLDTTIPPPSPTGDVLTTISSPSSTKDDVQTTTLSPRSTMDVVPIPPPPPLKGGGVYSAQEETVPENGKESNAKMIVGHFSCLPKVAVGPTGGNEVQPMGKRPFCIDQRVLVYSSVAFVPVSAYEDFEAGSTNRIAAVSDQKMDRKETARSRSTLESDEYIAQLYEQIKDIIELPQPEGKVIFSTCAEFTEGSMLPLPSAAAMADTIGKGGNGVVSYVYHMGKEFAVKETCLREEELRTLSKLSGQASRNVLPISAVMEGPPLDRYHGRRACYQLMPRATGDVRQMLDRSGSSTLCHYFFKYKQEPAKSSCVLANTRVVLRQTLRGLQHLHSKGIVHRDVKLQNILLDMRCGCGDVFLCPHQGRDSYRVYLADFDSTLDVERARGKLEERARKGSVLRFTPYGTQGYRAPETSFFHCSNQVLSPKPLGSLTTRMVLGSALTPYLNPAQDLWSFGCTVLKLFVGATGPTSQKEVASVLLADCLRRSTQSSSGYQHSVHGRLTVDDEEMKKLLKVSSVKKYFPLAVELQGLIRQCLQVDPHLRPSAEQCANLPFFKPIDPATDKNSYPSEPRQDTPAVELPFPTRVRDDTFLHQRDGNNEIASPKGDAISPNAKVSKKLKKPKQSVKSPKSSNGGNTGPPSSTPPVIASPKGDASSPNVKVSEKLKKPKQSMKSPKSSNGGNTGPPSSTLPVIASPKGDASSPNAKVSEKLKKPKQSVNSPKSSNGGNTGPPSSTPPVIASPKGDASSPNAKVSKKLKKSKQSVNSPKSSNGGNTGPPSSTPPEVALPKGDASSPNAKVSKMLKKQKEDDGRPQVVMLEGMQDEEKNWRCDLCDILRPVSDLTIPKSSHGGQSKSSSSEMLIGRDNSCTPLQQTSRSPDGK